MRSRAPSAGGGPAFLRDFPRTRAHTCVRASRGKGSLSIGDYVVRTGATLAGTASASASKIQPSTWAVKKAFEAAEVPCLLQDPSIRC